MRLRIHRGTKEIGGTCIEVEARRKRLALDVGLPLDATDDEGAHARLLPAVSGFRERDDSLLGVLISHPHQDHYGLARHIRPEVPVHSLGVLKWLEEHGIPLRSIHTSGHASPADLKRFAAALAPRALVPIHSFETGRFGEFFDNVVQRDDGEWWEV